MHPRVVYQSALMTGNLTAVSTTLALGSSVPLQVPMTRQPLGQLEIQHHRLTASRSQQRLNEDERNLLTRRLPWHSHRQLASRTLQVRVVARSRAPVTTRVSSCTLNGIDLPRVLDNGLALSSLCLQLTPNSPESALTQLVHLVGVQFHNEVTEMTLVLIPSVLTCGDDVSLKGLRLYRHKR